MEMEMECHCAKQFSISNFQDSEIVLRTDAKEQRTGE